MLLCCRAAAGRYGTSSSANMDDYFHIAKFRMKVLIGLEKFICIALSFCEYSASPHILLRLGSAN